MKGLKQNSNIRFAFGRITLTTLCGEDQKGTELEAGRPAGSGESPKQDMIVAGKSEGREGDWCERY